MSGEPVRLKYYQATFDMLGETPVVSAAALAKITAWERRHRAKLPGSLREWYALETAEWKWTCEPLDYDWFRPAPLEDVLQSLARLRKGRKGRGLLRLPIQGPEDELRYYAHLDGAEDPAVFAQADPARGEAEADWRIDAPSKKALVQTVTRVWPCGTLSQTLTSETRQGKAVLKELRSS